MNMTGFKKVSEDYLEKGVTYYLRTRFGQGFVVAMEATLDGWKVELQKDAAFTPPLKRFGVGDSMLVGNGSGTWYEVE